MNFILFACEDDGIVDYGRLDQHLKTHYLIVLNILKNLWILQTSDDALEVLANVEDILKLSGTKGITVLIDKNIALTNDISPEMFKLLFNK